VVSVEDTTPEFAWRGRRNEIQVASLCVRIKTRDYPIMFCGLVVTVADYKHRGPGFDSRALLRIFLRELGLERGPLSLVIG
jgi:hypothetical protein